tara:strand:- start:2177 stop:3232 length:1056 start_codon:yes stop_codon:yes gene_type:complete
MKIITRETIQAAILFEQNKPLKISELKLQEELEVGQVLIKVHTSGICGSQIGEIAGVKGKDLYLPHLMGHEGCGTVLQKGPGVKTVESGDKVVLHWKKGTGIESNPPKYFLGDKEINAGWITTFNTHAVVSENRCTKIPKDTDNELAALFGCAITTGFGVIENNAKLKMGESIVVFGAGGVGLNIIQAASMHSAWPIIAVDIYDNKLDLSKKFGATHTINTKKEDVTKKINYILGNKGVDIFIDNTGLTKIIELGYSLLNHQGRLILVGVPKIGSNINIFSLPMHFGKRIIGSYGGETSPEKDIPRFLNLYKNNKLNLKDLVSKKFKLQEINEAIEEFKNGSLAGRIIIEL